MFLGGMCAVGASQAPEFAQQYTQRLGGAVDELKVVVGHFDRDAAAVGLSRAGGLDRLDSSDDRFVNYRGKSIRTTVERFEKLTRHYSGMQAPDVTRRISEMLINMDKPTAKMAASDYRPAIPVTAEGFFAGLLGFLVGTLGGGVITALLKSFFLGRKNSALQNKELRS